MDKIRRTGEDPSTQNPTLRPAEPAVRQALHDIADTAAGVSTERSMVANAAVEDTEVLAEPTEYLQSPQGKSVLEMALGSNAIAAIRQPAGPIGPPEYRINPTLNTLVQKNILTQRARDLCRELFAFLAAHADANQAVSAYLEECSRTQQVQTGRQVALEEKLKQLLESQKPREASPARPSAVSVVPAIMRRPEERSQPDAALADFFEEHARNEAARASGDNGKAVEPQAGLHSFDTHSEQEELESAGKELAELVSSPTDGDAGDNRSAEVETAPSAVPLEERETVLITLGGREVSAPAPVTFDEKKLTERARESKKALISLGKMSDDALVSRVGTQLASIGCLDPETSEAIDAALRQAMILIEEGKTSTGKGVKIALNTAVHKYRQSLIDNAPGAQSFLTELKDSIVDTARRSASVGGGAR